MKVPALQHQQHLLLDAVTDALQQLGLDHIAAGVDRHLDDDIALNARRQIGAGNWRVGINIRKRGDNFVAAQR